MEHLAIDDADSAGFGGGVEHRALRDALGATAVSINRFRLDPDTPLPWGLHAHYDQEEVFIVLEGTVTFETLAGRTAVAAGEAVRFAPGEYQAASNAGDRPATFLAIGAPAGTEDMRVPLPCASCDGEELRIELSSDTLVCPSCGDTVDARCPVCGENEREARLSGDGSVLIDRCRSCGDRRDVRPLP